MNVYKNVFPNGKTHALTVSYDDPAPENERLIEIFRKYGIRGTFHLNSGRMKDCDTADIRRLYDGFEISCHTHTHPFLSTMPKENILWEIQRDREELEKIACYPVRGMSYPFGCCSEEIDAACRVCGIEYGRVVASSFGFELPTDPLRWVPTCHHREGIADLFTKFSNNGTFRKQPHASASLFYIWGHARDYERNKNWEIIEEFGELVAPHADNIWFATNIEIIDYMNAQKNVRYSLDGSTAFNPSNMSVWVTIHREKVEIKPGLNIIPNA